MSEVPVPGQSGIHDFDVNAQVVEPAGNKEEKMLNYEIGECAASLPSDIAPTPT